MSATKKESNVGKGRPPAAGRAIRIRVSPVVDERLKAQAEVFGMPVAGYASMLVAQLTLTNSQAQTALQGAIEAVAQRTLDTLDAENDT